ncbi:Hypothetical predicted protein [Xyrichtys novacula]|uniref:Uncharacterized protein n=1 Tax=Xyrichtys novacula TaxID=13765 RepID=A0AAV1GXI4_XYRNO|nr:Hypothetical predicted protein [Xyrichtys novacula]
MALIVRQAAATGPEYRYVVKCYQRGVLSSDKETSVTHTRPPTNQAHRKLLEEPSTSVQH